MHGVVQKGRKITTNCQQADAKVYSGKSVSFLSVGVLMATPKSSDISKIEMQYLSCIHSSWSDFELLTFHRPAIKDDQWQRTILCKPHLNLSLLSFGYNETPFGTLPWTEQPSPFHLLHNINKLVSVSPLVPETCLILPTIPAYGHHLHRRQFLFT